MKPCLTDCILNLQGKNRCCSIARSVQQLNYEFEIILQGEGRIKYSLIEREV